jgi:hypothetical protein
LSCDLLIPGSFGDQIHDLILPRGKQALSLGIDDAGWGGRTEGFDHVLDLFGVGPKLAAVNRRDAAAESPEWLTRATEQSMGPRAHCVNDQIAIIAVQQKNKPDPGMVTVEPTKDRDKFVVLRRAVAQKQHVDRRCAQGLQASGKVAAAARYLQARMAAKRAAQQVGLGLVGIGYENTDAFMTPTG